MLPGRHRGLPAQLDVSARMRQRQRARADGRVRGPAPGGARAPKAEARRSHVWGRGFLRGRALPPRPRSLGAVPSRRMWSPVVGWGLRPAPQPGMPARAWLQAFGFAAVSSGPGAAGPGREGVSGRRLSRGGGISSCPSRSACDPRPSRSSRAPSLQAAACGRLPVAVRAAAPRQPAETRFGVDPLRVSRRQTAAPDVPLGCRVPWERELQKARGGGGRHLERP